MPVIHNCGKKRPDPKTMNPSEWYFYFDKKPCLAIKNQGGIILRIGLDTVLKGVDLYNAILNQTAFSPEDENELIQKAKLAHLYSNQPLEKLPDGKTHIDFTIPLVQEQTEVLKNEFKIALTARHAYNLEKKDGDFIHKPTSFTDGDWIKQCNAFKQAGEDVLAAVNKIPNHFHDEDDLDPTHKPVSSQIKKMLDSPRLLDRKDLDGSKRVLVNQLLSSMTQDLEFYPTTPQEAQIHVRNLKNIHELSSKVLGHRNSTMQTMGAVSVIFAGLMISLVVGGVLAIPTGGLSLILPAAMLAAIAGVLPYSSFAMMGMMGLACVFAGRETGIAKATSNYKQVFKEMNQTMNDDITTAYQEEKDKESWTTKLSGGSF